MDQVGISDYSEPELVTDGAYAYVGFPTKMQPPSGVWAGVNECGLALVGADGNAIVDLKGKCYKSLNLSLYAYREILASCDDIYSAIKAIIYYYQSNSIGGNGDIIMMSDHRDAVAMEYLHPQWGVEFLDRRHYMVRTNFFNNLRHLRPALEDNTVHCSSALRYQRAFMHLSIKGPETDVDDVENILRDHANGPSALSICRHGGRDEYITRCASIFTVSDTDCEVRYVVNAMPCEKKFTSLTLDWAKNNH